MATKKIKAKKNNTAARVGVGAVAVTGVALAALGAYLLSGKEGQARRKKMKAWADAASKEVMRKAKEAKKLGQAEYDRIVDAAVKRYGKLEDIDINEVMKTAQELKAGWDKIKTQAEVTAKAVSQHAKKTTKPKKVRRTQAKKG